MLVVCVMHVKLNAQKAVASAERKDHLSPCSIELKCRKCMWVWRILPAKHGDAHQNRASLYSNFCPQTRSVRTASIQVEMWKCAGQS